VAIFPDWAELDGQTAQQVGRMAVVLAPPDKESSLRVIDDGAIQPSIVNKDVQSTAAQRPPDFTGIVTDQAIQPGATVRRVGLCELIHQPAYLIRSSSRSGPSPLIVACESRRCAIQRPPIISIR